MGTLRIHVLPVIQAGNDLGQKLSLLLILYSIQRLMTTKDQLKSIYVRLSEMNDFLGGDKQKNPNKKDSEFDFIKNEFLERRHQTEKLYEQKEQTSKPSELGNLAFKIRDLLTKCKELLDKLESEQGRQEKKNKIPEPQLQRQRKILENCQALYNDLVERGKLGGNQAQNRIKVQTLTDLKARLLKDISVQTNEIEKLGSEDSFFNTDNDEEEKAAMEEFKAQDQIMDDRLGGIVDRIEGLKQQARRIGEANDEVHTRVQKNTKAVGDMTKKIKTQNQRLKVIIEKFKPSSCCLTVVFFLLLVGLAVVVINMIINK